ncbi:fatty acyl-CoA synthetase [Alicyclobacillus sp. SO9]|uniref:fatty acyl-CoA synthetase n=1 Tax=Alicyclobacillus sp. SO9 TaxID=2665646 RepID=UPI0018E79A11|nr:fatty acyl-CoA synthetase [Alicyclobacillus sp. SO9]QQE81273.1 long-chain-fatty-acid--CoA ligase [Alicyclobacillus sp. SO9]
MSSEVGAARRNTMADLLERSSARYGDKLALVYGEERIDYSEFQRRVNTISAQFLRDGISSSSKLVVLSKNSLNFVLAYYAAMKIGAIWVPVNYMLTPSEIAYILGHTKADVVLAASNLVDTMNKAIATVQESTSSLAVDVTARYVLETAAEDDSIRSHDPRSWHALEVYEPSSVADADTGQHTIDLDGRTLAQILYTSGTESLPKGVMLTHDNLISQFVSCIVDGSMEHHDIAIHALPLYHSAQLNCFLGPSIYLGGTGIILDAAAPDIILRTIEKERATLLFCPPTVWIALLRHPDFEKRDLSSLQKCYYGAAIMPVEVLKELSSKLPQARFWNFYGQTEVAPLATVLKPEDQLRKLGSAGRPALNVETIIVDAEGNPVPAGEVGEIVHRTAHAMLGYLDDAQKTSEAYRGGWFHSGDLGVMDEEGYLTIVDRKKDMIKTGGVNVASREVEEAIYEFPGVSEVAVIGLPDDYWIEAVTAIIVPKTGIQFNEQDLLQFLREKLAKFKLPKQIVIADALPRNPSGKILKRNLRQEYEDSVKSLPEQD